MGTPFSSPDAAAAARGDLAASTAASAGCPRSDGGTATASGDSPEAPWRLRVFRRHVGAMGLSRGAGPRVHSRDGLGATLADMTVTIPEDAAREAGLHYAHDDRPGSPAGAPGPGSPTATGMAQRFATRRHLPGYGAGDPARLDRRLVSGSPRPYPGHRARRAGAEAASLPRAMAQPPRRLRSSMDGQVCEGAPRPSESDAMPPLRAARPPTREGPGRGGPPHGADS